MTTISSQVGMQVRKRNGDLEVADVNKIVRAVNRCAGGLTDIDPLRVATKTISGLYDGATTNELDRLSIQTAALLTGEEPQYSILAARLLATVIEKEVRNQEIHSFSQSIAAGYKAGLISEDVVSFVVSNSRKLNAAIDHSRDEIFEYFGLRTVYDRYLLREPVTRDVIETPQYMFLRIACGLAKNVQEALAWYELFSALDYLPSSPTLFNSGTSHPQLSSCFLLDSPKDELESIYNKYTEVALLSKFAGGIGLSYSRIRAAGSLIRGTNGKSLGIIPFLKTLDSSVAAVNQGGKRKGAACVYLETWHADIESFLELRDNTGDDARRTHNLNLANWIPDLFMRRVEEDGSWSLFDPKDVPSFTDLWGERFEAAYTEAEAKGMAVRTVPARELYGKMMRTLAQTGNGWICFKDTSNRHCNQTAEDGNTVHLSNLCTEIIEVSSDEQTAVCNLGSINLGRHVTKNGVDYAKLAQTVDLAIRQLDRVIDKTFYPVEKAGTGNRQWRPVGLGVMGLQDVFFTLGLPFDSDEARAVSTRIAEEIAFHAFSASCDLAESEGPHPAYDRTRVSRGELLIDAWKAATSDPARWETLRARVAKHGLKNSLLIAIAPTATIAAIAGCYECIEPQASNLFKRETLSGEFLQVNRYLVTELKQLGLWDEQTRNAIKAAEGSIQGIEFIPEAVRARYRTAWELPQRALIDLAAERAQFIDQSQSLNLFSESPTIGKLSSMYLYAWKRGLKTTYYLRSRPATRIAKATISAGTNVVAAPKTGDGAARPASGPTGGGTATVPTVAGSAMFSNNATAVAPVAVEAVPEARTYTVEEQLACSLENPEYCEACQ